MSNNPTRVIVVLAAVIERDGHFFITRRMNDTHLAGLWEFPGGKCDEGETHEDCLRRELVEELGVDAEIGAELIVSEHTYSERTVRLHFRRCEIVGEPRPLLGQEMRWVGKDKLRGLEFPAADKTLIELLSAGDPSPT